MKNTAISIRRRRSLDRQFAEKAAEMEALRKKSQALPTKVRVRNRPAERPDNYAEYLRSPHWLKFRRRVLKKRNRCESCGAQYSQYGLTLHHLTYASLGAEREDHVAVLCWPCHQERHACR